MMNKTNKANKKAIIATYTAYYELQGLNEFDADYRAWSKYLEDENTWREERAEIRRVWFTYAFMYAVMMFTHYLVS